MSVLVLYDVWTPKRREKAQLLTSAIRVRGMIYHKDSNGNRLNMEPWLLDFMGAQNIRGSMYEHAFVGYDYEEQEWLAAVVDRATLPHIDLIDHRP
jgi:hypothetical protein